MASTLTATQHSYQEALGNYLIAMARTVSVNVSRALTALENLHVTGSEPAGDIFLLEPRINEMEIIIDDRAVRMLRHENLSEAEIRQVVATLKITNDLERMGDLAVALAERIVSLAAMPPFRVPPEIKPMVLAVGSMVENSLSALICRDPALASQVLASDDLVDRYKDQIFEQLMVRMTERPVEVAPGLQFVLASRHLERLADHATNIAEDIIFWVRGLDVRHGRAYSVRDDPTVP